MISADHLAEAKAYVDELTLAADYIPGTPEWLEHVSRPLQLIDADALGKFAAQLAQAAGPVVDARPWIADAVVTGFLVALIAERLAERDSDTPDVPSQRFATLSGPDSTTGVGWPE